MSCAILIPNPAILQIRLYAMYGRDKRILVLMLTTFLISITGSAIALGVILTEITSMFYSYP